MSERPKWDYAEFERRMGILEGFHYPSSRGKTCSLMRNVFLPQLDYIHDTLPWWDFIGRRAIRRAREHYWWWYLRNCPDISVSE